MHGHHGLVLLEGATTDTSQLLHMSTTAEKIANMDAEGTNVSTSLAAHPENTHITVLVILNQLGLVDGPNSELFLDRGDQRRSLEAGALERIKCLLQLLDLVDGLVQFDDGDVLFTSGLLGLDQAGCVVDAHDEAAGDFWVERARVASLVDFENFLDPSDDFVRGWVRWLVEVDHTILLQDVDWAIRR